MYVTLTNLVGSEGGKVFPGGSFVAGPKGDVRGRAPLWEDAILSVTLDLADVTRARADMPLIADLETMMPHLRASIDEVMAGVPTTLSSTIRPRSEPPRSAPSTPAATPTPRRADGAAGRARSRPSREHAAVAARDRSRALTEQWLVHFIRDEMERRGFKCAVVGVSGGVDSAVTAYLAAKALGPKNVLGVRMPYRTSSKESLDHAQLVIDALGIESRTIDITPAVDGYLANEPDADGGRRGNVMARMRMITLFDLAAKHRGIPLGTGNKTERLFGYFTWHADDSPPINPLGDLFKTQVWALARHLGVPDVIVEQAADGGSRRRPDRRGRLRDQLREGRRDPELAAERLHARRARRRAASTPNEVAIVRKRVESTHWKRRLPTVAMVSPTAIGESYLRPVDY